MRSQDNAKASLLRFVARVLLGIRAVIEVWAALNAVLIPVRIQLTAENLISSAIWKRAYSRSRCGIFRHQNQIGRRIVLEMSLKALD
jgi:hypothetical protein